MRRVTIATIAASVLLAAPPGEAAEAVDSVRVVLKFVKQRGIGAVRFDPASCPDCTIVSDATWNADNPRETVIALTVPQRRTIELGFTSETRDIRRVVVEGDDVPFRREGRRLVVALPPLDDDRITAAEFATHIVEPGMVLRFEHADPARRAGAYATGAFPVRQRRAADVLEFAQREVVRMLGLGRMAEARGLGRIQIMGFDTNAPHGHTDAPPHVHMHLRWPGNAGTQIGHYYIGEDGLLTHNIVGIKGIPAPDRRFGRGERFTTIGPDGAPAYSHRITPEGWLEIAGPDGATCLIRPTGPGGFENGAWVECAGTSPRRITVADDIGRGRLTVTTNDVTEVFAYDRDTGALLPPPALRVPPSVFERRLPVVSDGDAGA